MTFVRRPEQADIDDYLERRAAALDKAHAKWVRRHADWERALVSWRKYPRPDMGPAQRPIEPVEPTDANLAFPAIEQERMMTLGPFNRFSKADGRSTFVEQVPPGRYAFYGPVGFLQAVTGTCMCMGTIEFEVKPGQIVHAGMMKINLMAERARARAEEAAAPRQRARSARHDEQHRLGNARSGRGDRSAARGLCDRSGRAARGGALPQLLRPADRPDDADPRRARL
ncbi:MAG: hypothetical protein WDN24_05835 [Sphingomonas sp.]